LIQQLCSIPDPEQSGEWPVDRLNCLIDHGVFRWGLPEEVGGLPVSSPQLLEGYLELARVCLTTTFILTQRDAACQRIARSSNATLRQKLLPGLISGAQLATVGISHLSTSRQHWSRPSVAAMETDAGYELTGEAPWVTGASHANILVTGATRPDQQQVLVAIPTSRAGLQIEQPLKMLALDASCTGTVVLDRVLVGHEEVVVGPVLQAMKVGATGGTGSFTTTAVAIGASARTIDQLRLETASRPSIAAQVEILADEHARLRADLLSAANTDAVQDGSSKELAELLRLRANSLASRAAQVYVACAKGAGFIRGHAAERAMREAMFFQVWSCPPAVTARSLEELVSPNPAT
jgi:alkylation response protein AidB-like acyl-CoA dehydrogenase